MKFYLKHHWGGGKASVGFDPDRIRTLVSMATDSSHIVIMGKTASSRFNGALLTVYLYMLYPIATFQKAGTCLDDHQSMAKQQHGETANQKLCE